jgi:hypothetical protein
MPGRRERHLSLIILYGGLPSSSYMGLLFLHPSSSKLGSFVFPNPLLIGDAQNINLSYHHECVEAGGEGVKRGEQGGSSHSHLPVLPQEQGDSLAHAAAAFALPLRQVRGQYLPEKGGSAGHP